MKKFLLSLCAVSVVFGLAGAAHATWYNFDFNGLDEFATAAEIESYMVSTSPPPGAVVISSDTTTGSVGDNSYLMSDGEPTIEITFTERKILEIKFDWQSEIDYMPSGAETKGFYAYADGSDIPFYSYVFSDTEWEGSDSVYINFTDPDINIAPVSSLKFTNSPSNGYITLDNLQIENENPPSAVPEPATMLLLGSGLIGLAAIGRKKLFKKS